MTDMLPELIAGRYEMRRRLGSSSVARVVLAHDVQLDRPVALKVLSPELSRDAGAVDRFRAAAMSAGTIQDDAVVRAYDVVEHGGRAILVMEYVDGSNLSDAILTNRRFPAPEAARIGASIARGLDAVHRAGLVHGGLTPRDVLLSSAGSVKITDVGLAQVGLAGLDPVARATYAAPEQLQGRQGDARSDLYALGVILQELVTGRPPFGGTDLMSLTDQKLSEDPPLPSVTDPSVPPVYDAVVGSLLARDPALRPASAAAVASDLGRLEATLAVPAAVAPTQTAMPAAVAATTVLPTTPTAPPPAAHEAARHGLDHRGDRGARARRRRVGRVRDQQERRHRQGAGRRSRPSSVRRRARRSRSSRPRVSAPPRSRSRATASPRASCSVRRRSRTRRRRRARWSCSR